MNSQFMIGETVDIRGPGGITVKLSDSPMHCDEDILPYVVVELHDGSEHPKHVRTHGDHDIYLRLPSYNENIEELSLSLPDLRERVGNFENNHQLFAVCAWLLRHAEGSYENTTREEDWKGLVKFATTTMKKWREVYDKAHHVKTDIHGTIIEDNNG